VKVDELLPAGMSLVSIAGTGWDCDADGASCTIASMAPGTATIHVVAQLASAVADGTSLSNGAGLSWVDTDGSHTGDSSAAITAVAQADLALTKTAADTNVEAGTTTSFQLAVQNKGVSDAVGPITIVDQLPAGMTFVGSTGSAWQCSAEPASASGQTVTCATDASVGIVANGSAPALAVKVALDETLQSGQITNTATVSSPTDDPDPSDNTATATVQVDPVDDLSITKTHAGPVEIGKDLVFHLAVANAGPSTATGVSVSDRLPVGLAYVSADGSDPAWSCTPGSPDDAGTLVSCQLDGTVAAGDGAPALALVTTVQPAAYPKVTNTASVSSATTDADSSNNEASDPVIVPAQVDLHITKTHAGTVQVGQHTTYTIAVTNTGSTELPAGYVVTDRLPDGLTLVSASGAHASCVAHGQTVECTVDHALAAGGTAQIQVVVQVGASAFPAVTNTASVATTAQNVGTDPLSAQDAAHVQAAPSDPPGLAVTGTSGAWRWALLGAAIAIAAGLGLLAAARRRRLG
jgi:large repetitive protein